MITLQHAHSILTEVGMSPVKRTRLYRTGNTVRSSLYAIEVYCPVIAFRMYEKRICGLLPDGLNLIYLPCSEIFRIEAGNGRLQWIANQIESCESTEQLECCERIILNTYGDMQPELFKMMIAKVKTISHI